MEREGTAMPIHAFRDYHPQIDPTAYIADDAQVIGNVILGPNVSVWFNAVLRGDNDRIVVGAGSNIQDGSIIHVDEGVPCIIGAGVVMGHRAILHGCQVGEECLIGMGAIVLNQAHLGPGCIVGAGAVVPEGKVFPPRALLLGVPAKVVRVVTDQELINIRASAARYARLAAMYKAEFGDD
jgi:carbonic anhydrase/acetyltransferase-like protein (isoleucine patch superfamily)